MEPQGLAQGLGLVLRPPVREQQPGPGPEQGREQDLLLAQDRLRADLRVRKPGPVGKMPCCLLVLLVSNSCSRRRIKQQPS